MPRKRANSPILPHEIVIAKSSGISTGWIVTIGDPYRSGSTILRILRTRDDLRCWRQDNVGRNYPEGLVRDFSGIIG